MKLAILLGAFAIGCAPAAAVAHAFLSHSNPCAGAKLNSAPSTVALAFSERLEPQSSGVAVTDSAGHSVQAGTSVVGGNSIFAPLLPLPPGRYRVVWHAVSLDDHRTQGSYSFVIKP
jgi:methionine-rich copper-binding protein CopC